MLSVQSLDQTTFQKLSRLYLVALSFIAIALIISQLLVQDHLDGQINDSRIVNVAGRQRMLSQKLIKNVLLLDGVVKADQWEILQQLKRDLQLWKDSHEALTGKSHQAGIFAPANSDTIRQMFDHLMPTYDSLSQQISYLINKNEGSVIESGTDDFLIRSILKNERDFLAQMDQIVFRYDHEAQEKVFSLKRTEYFLLALSLIVLVFELFFVFRPAAGHTRKIISGLIASEAQSNKMRDQLQILHDQKEESLKELRTLHFALDQAALFISTSPDGQIQYISDKFCRLLGVPPEKAKGQLTDLINTSETDRQYILNILQEAGNKIYQLEILVWNQQEQKKWLDMSILPVNSSSMQRSFLILGSDITARKNIQYENDLLREQQFEEKINQQKNLSIKVLEAEEEERKRIAREIHDGIGQMLTALKFNIQSLLPLLGDKNKLQIDKLNSLVVNLIKGVRIATFNLIPPELSDYGIASAIGKMVQELQKLTGKNVLFENRTGFEGRLEPMIETNLYRVVQEALNNALKYAGSSYILITLTHSDHIISIAVDDDGIGFDKDKFKENTSMSQSQYMGLIFMEERMKLINARLFISSETGGGTRVTINLPLPSPVEIVV
jgi:two-component system, NarL family, sensor histidine kinase DegS